MNLQIETSSVIWGHKANRCPSRRPVQNFQYRDYMPDRRMSNHSRPIPGNFFGSHNQIQNSSDLYNPGQRAGDYTFQLAHQKTIPVINPVDVKTVDRPPDRNDFSDP
uniref:Uncharacterized protein n=1 Tax=Ditylenchus dipsaci TaxID=166011 RepID=A0A915DJS0_9BILA